MINLFKLIGALGIILIAIGILNKKKYIEDIFYIFGGICLEIYSIYLGDIIFIILEVIFILVALYDFIKEKFF